MSDLLKQLAQQSYIDVPHERDWDVTVSEFSRSVFAKLILAECLEICGELEDRYAKLRKQTDDFGYKNTLAAGEVAASGISSTIRAKFGVDLKD